MKKIIKSSQLNDLGYQMIDEIKKRNSFFSSMNIVVPSKRVSEWFKAFWLKNQSEMLININFRTMKEVMPMLIDDDRNFEIMSRQQLFSYILEEIHDQKSQEYLPEQIRNYLLDEHTKALNPQKAYDLAKTFTSLFMEYEDETMNITGYQKTIHDNVLIRAKSHNQTTLLDMLRNKSDMKRMENLFFFGFTSLTGLEETILDEYALEYDFSLYQLEDEKRTYVSPDLVLAPSMTREVEALHSQICKIIRDDSSVSYSDFLVIIPCMNEYATTIRRVFTSGDEKFPSIPYSINQREKVDSDITDVLNILFNTIAYESYTRDDFMSLASNKTVMAARGITEDEITAFTDSILDMEVYRKALTRDDFDYAKKRLLLSMVSSINDGKEGIIKLKDKEYLPYSSIDMNHEAIIKFVKMIDDIMSFKKTMENIVNITHDSYVQIITEFDKWFSIKDKNGNETNGVYQKLLRALKCFDQTEKDCGCVSLEAFVYFAKEESRIEKKQSTDFFTSGITFTSFEDNLVLSAKYIFFLNAGSASLPKKISVSELDIRDREKVIRSKTETEKRTFFLLCRNAEHFQISYINRDLKTDEEKYPSGFLLELIGGDLKNLTERKQIISLDETRDYSELFTKKEFVEKDYYNNLLSDHESVQENDDIITKEFQNLNKFDINRIAEFLHEPLIYKTNRLFGKDDDKDEQIQNEYEPFEFDNAKSSVLVRKIVLDLLRNHPIDVSLNEEKIQIDYEQYDELKRELNLQHKIPDINKPINDEDFRNLIDRAIKVQKLISKESGNSYEILRLEDLPMHYSSEDGTTEETWVLTCNNEICRHKSENLNSYYLCKDNPSNHDLLKLYSYALMDIASIGKNSSYVHEINLYCGIDKNGKELKETFSVSSDEARDILNKIYHEMNDSNDMYYLSSPMDNDFKSFEKLKETFLDEKFFSHKMMFDPDKDLGYDKTSFKKLYAERRAKMKSLVLISDANNDNKEESED